MAEISPNSSPALDSYYLKYLKTEDSAGFISQVASRYSIPSLHRLIERGQRVTRRSAALAIGFLGSMSSNAVLGRALHDKDRAVRLLAEHGLRQLWFRAGTSEQFHQLNHIVRLNDNGQFQQACELATEILDQSPELSEAWNQRAIALFGMNEFFDSVMDCHQALEFNAYQFNAAMGMGHGYLQMEDMEMALDSFRRALKLNPNMEHVRGQVQKLERTAGKDRWEE